jgi:hypothetical protein
LGVKEPSAGLFSLRPLGDGGVSWDIAPPQNRDTEQIAGVNAADLTALDQLDPPPRSVRDAAERLRWGNGRTTASLREWRRSRSAPRNEEQPWT